MACDVEERLGKSFWNGWIGLAAGRCDRGALRESFDESDAERPDIAGGGERRGGELGRVVGVEIA